MSAAFIDPKYRQIERRVAGSRQLEHLNDIRLIAAAESSRQIVYNQRFFGRLTEIADGNQEDSEDRL